MTCHTTRLMTPDSPVKEEKRAVTGVRGIETAVSVPARFTAIIPPNPDAAERKKARKNLPLFLKRRRPSITTAVVTATVIRFA